jgi:uncharacterized membrane protein YfcA
MEYIIIAIAVTFASILTFFSGFGLGTIMLPIFALFFPIEVAVAATALVHFANNVFKFGFVYKSINIPVALQFGLPAIATAVLGSFLLKELGSPAPLGSYTLGGHRFDITLLKIVIGTILIFFAFFEFVVKSKKFSFDTNRLWLGGIITGFFGGLSGHQGAFRSAFLAQTDLDKASFIATSNVLSLGIDISRLLVYSSIFSFQLIVENQNILYVGILFAFVGTYFGSKLLHKTTMDGVQKTVGIALILMGAGLISGLL